MSDKSSSSLSSGIGFAGLLTILFVALKLGIGDTAVQGWPWRWVLCPLWAVPAVILAVVLVVAIAANITYSIEVLGKACRKKWPKE